MLTAHELAADARDGLAIALDGSKPETHAGAVGVLTDTASTIENVAKYAGTLSTALTAFANRIGARGAGTVAVASAGASEPVRPVAVTAAPAMGRWRGKTATEHVLTGGADIGRAAEGRKRMNIRLLDSYAELHEVFNALKVGAVLEDKPRYDGQFYRFPDGTTIAYRTHSRSGGDNDPTLDFAVPGEQTTTFKVPKKTLKVHVDHKEQDHTQ
ncbi:hypothetical protein [Allokutzneria albata]|uniref:hypothetical protein n=1 Tax=Allokutzneria albata TaxID=211114 RepID=UPI0012DF0E31|nr:hypothetical protein [Allokutzneria albata]